MKSLKGALHQIRQDEKNAKNCLISDINGGNKTLKYANKQEKIEYLIRNSNMSTYYATNFYNTHIIN